MPGPEECMKKPLAVLIGAGLFLSLTGCSAEQIREQLFIKKEPTAVEAVPHPERVYMDELRGTLSDFNGNILTLQSEDALYSFDISQASVECKNGLISGDSISVIYEGQLEDNHTDSVKALKVVDEYHQKPQLETHVAEGQLQSLTPNTITILTAKGRSYTFPLTGAKQYYQAGIRTGQPLYIHYKGNLSVPANAVTNSGINSLKVISVSDAEPFAAPEPTPTPDPDTDVPQEKQLSCIISNASLQNLEAVIAGTAVPVRLDMSAIPCYFPSGIHVGSMITVSYSGEFNGTTLEGLTLLRITGEDLTGQTKSRISTELSGMVVSTTANTFTLRTEDGVLLTFYTEGASNLSTGGLASGCFVKITFNPADSGESNIYSCIKIEDA